MLAILCEKRSNLTRTVPLTTGTFNLIVKDRVASPPERRVFGSAGLIRDESNRPRNLSKISLSLRGCQLSLLTGFPHRPERLTRFDRQRSTRNPGLPGFLRSRTHLPSRSSAESGRTHDFGTSRDGKIPIKIKIVWRFFHVAKPERLTDRTLRGTLSPNTQPRGRG